MKRFWKVEHFIDIIKGSKIVNLENNLNTNTVSHKIKGIFISFLVILTIIQQMPIIKDLYYEQIRGLLYFLFGLLTAVSLISFNRIIKYKTLKFFSLVILYGFVLAIVVYFFTRNISDFNLGEIVVPYGVLICSLSTYFTDIQIRRLLRTYIILAAVLGISSVFFYGSGFIINQNYFLEAKNQIGTLLGVATIIAEVLLVKDQKASVRKKIVLFTLFIGLLFSIVFIRNRSSLVGIFGITCLLSGNVLRGKKTIKFYLLLTFLLIGFIIATLTGVFDGLMDIFINSLTMNYDVTDLDSLSAGRTDVYLQAIDFIKNNFFLGEMGGTEFISTTLPHNYVLNKMVELGFLGSLLFLSLYFYFWIFVIKNLFLKRSKYLYGIPLWVMLFSLIISLFEYTYPYGPGTSQLMVWFMLGQQLNNAK